MVGLVRSGLALDAITAQFVFRLRGTEQVGGQFRAAHVVQDFLAFLQAFVPVDVFGTQLHRRDLSWIGL